MRTALAAEPAPAPAPFANQIADWHELRSALLTAEAVTVAALAREESRGAHQRDDFPQTRDELASNRSVKLADDVAVSDEATPS
jgi:succinate dehydrogenase/fumarate reductase flavoprotein subunit